MIGHAAVARLQQQQRSRKPNALMGALQFPARLSGDLVHCVQIALNRCGFVLLNGKSGQTERPKGEREERMSSGKCPITKQRNDWMDVRHWSFVIYLKR